MAVSTAGVARDLEELIAALDRRLPSVARAGESGIARDAAALRAHAVKRLREVKGHGAGDRDPVGRRGAVNATALARETDTLGDPTNRAQRSGD